MWKHQDHQFKSTFPLEIAIILSVVSVFYSDFFLFVECVPAFLVPVNGESTLHENIKLYEDEFSYNIFTTKGYTQK